MPSKQKSAARLTYMLRTCNAALSSSHGFVWPTSGPVTCPDWDPEPCCGYGLHGLLMGQGNGELLDWEDDAKWLVVEINAAEVVDLDGKVKVPGGVVVFCGARDGAIAFIVSKGADPALIVCGTATAGYAGTATAGYAGTATAGHRGTATAGDSGTATAGDSGTATASYAGTATAGHRGTATAGDSGTATAGYAGTATAGHRGTATAGHRGTATAGDSGTATAGYAGTATAGDSGTATAGYAGTVMVRYWDFSASRYRTAIGYVGEDGILPDVPYRVEDGRLVAAHSEQKQAA